MSPKKEDNYTTLEELYENESIPDTASEADSEEMTEYDYKVKQGNSFFNKSMLNVFLTILFVSISVFGLNSEFYNVSNYKFAIKVISIVIMSSLSFLVNYFF